MTIGWDLCIAAVLGLAAGTGVFGYVASRYTESEEAGARARQRGLLAPRTLYTSTDILYKVLSYACAGALVVTLVGCYLSWPKVFAAVGVEGDVYLYIFASIGFVAGIINHAASRCRRDTDSDLVHWLKGNHSFWSGLTRTGRKLRLVSLGLFAVAIGFLMLWIAA